jgi:hypothetical protein
MANSAVQLSARAREHVTLLRVVQRYRTARTALWVSFCGFVVWCLYLSVDSIAGKTTAFQAAITVGFSLLWDIRLVVAFSLAGATTIWAVAERWLRHRKVNYLQGRIKDLELNIDPGRTTSGLTTKGRTNPRDRGR